MDISKNDNVL